MPKYQNIKTLSLEKDDNEYRVGVYGSGMSKKCDFYINDELIFKEISFRNGNSIKVLKSGYFINLRDTQGNNRIIRYGDVIFKTRYNVVNAHAMIDYDANGIEFISDTYLIVVSRVDGLKGVYSTNKRMLVLPFKYSTIDIDEHFNIILGEKVNIDEYDGDLKDSILKSMRKGEFMQIGNFSRKHNWVSCKGAKVYGDEVDIYDDWRIHYTWNDGFSEFEEEDEDSSGVNVPSDWDDYSHDDSLYDALGGEMDARWNID